MRLGSTSFPRRLVESRGQRFSPYGSSRLPGVPSPRDGFARATPVAEKSLAKRNLGHICGIVPSHYVHWTRAYARVCGIRYSVERYSRNARRNVNTLRTSCCCPRFDLAPDLISRLREPADTFSRRKSGNNVRYAPMFREAEFRLFLSQTRFFPGRRFHGFFFFQISID